MKISILLFYLLLSACSSSKLVMPSNKSENDYYADENACKAEAKRALPGGWGESEYRENCMLAKGYRWVKVK